jgi:hypothetical protein
VPAGTIIEDALLKSDSVVEANLILNTAGWKTASPGMTLICPVAKSSVIGPRRTFGT